jgi:lysophospholipase L1-like esterase
MKQYIVLFITLAALITALLNGCTDSAPTGPVIGLGNSTVTKYVSVGNSLTAGYQSNGLYESAQIYSYPNLIAQQLRKAGANIGTFNQPIIPDPGNTTTILSAGPSARYEILSLVGPVIAPKPGQAGVVFPYASTGLTQPYDNLGIPGAVIYDFLDTMDLVTKATARQNPFFIVVQRSNIAPALGKSVFRQILTFKALGQTPDLVTFWLGANDVLGFATGGGVIPATGNAPTPPLTFQYLYNIALDTLRKTLPNAKIVVGNIPNVTSIPFFTTVNPLLAPSIPTLYYLCYQKHGEGGISTGSTKLTETNAPLITLKGEAYAALLGQHPMGKWYRDNNYSSLPAGIDTMQPFGFHPQNPWPDALILDSLEIAMATDAVNSFNSIIASVAAAKGAAVVDFNGFFNNVKANGLIAYGEEYTVDYILGNIFSLDGVHPSNRGYGIVANEYIKVINSSFGMNIPLVDLNTLPKLAAPLSKGGNGKIDPVLPFGAFSSFDWLFSPSVQ